MATTDQLVQRCKNIMATNGPEKALEFAVAHRLGKTAEKLREQLDAVCRTKAALEAQAHNVRTIANARRAKEVLGHVSCLTVSEQARRINALRAMQVAA
jgi:hypothetical protein